MIPRFLLHLLLLLYKLSVSDILVQIRYDTCIPILYGLNYYCPFWTSCAYICGLQTHFYSSTGVHFNLKILPPPAEQGVFSCCDTIRGCQRSRKATFLAPSFNSKTILKIRFSVQIHRAPQLLSHLQTQAQRRPAFCDSSRSCRPSNFTWSQSHI